MAYPPLHNVSTVWRSLAFVPLLAIGVSGSAFGGAFSSFDPRSMALGGCGVAIPSPANAPIFNPALLSVYRDGEQFQLDLPVLGGRAFDPDDFVEALDAFQANAPASRLDTNISSFNQHLANGDYNSPQDATMAADLRSLADDSLRLNHALAQLDRRRVGAEFGAGLVMVVPGKRVGMALSMVGGAALSGIVYYRDNANLSTLSGELNAYADQVDPAVTAAAPASSTYIDPQTGEVRFTSSTDLASEVSFLGMAVVEMGISLAREVTVGQHKVAIGITPKSLRVVVFDYQQGVEQAETSAINDHYADYRAYNLDLGISAEHREGWRSGLVLKNLRRLSFESPDDPSRQVKIQPQLRIGLSRQTSGALLAADVDITTSEASGIADRSRYLSLGGEFRVGSWWRLRGGYRVNMALNKRSIYSFGVGFSPPAFHLDLAMAGNQDEVGVSGQLGIHF